MLHRVALGTLLCTVGVMTGWGFSRRFLVVRSSRTPNVAESPIREGQAPSIVQRWTGLSFVSSDAWKTETSPDLPTYSDRRWFGLIFPKGNSSEDKGTRFSVILEWITSLLPHPHILGESVAPWNKDWLGGDEGSRIIYRYLVGFKDGTSWIWKRSFNLIQPIKHAVDRISLSNSVLVLLSTLPYAFLSAIRLWPWSGPCKQLGKGGNRNVSVATSGLTSQNSMSSAKAVEIIKRFQGLQLANSNAEKDVIRKAEELELMSKLMEFLLGKCQHQSTELQRKVTELEELARAVEHLQRPSSKRWSDLLDRVYKNTYPAVIKIEYYKLHVPLDGADKGDNSVTLPNVLEKDDSETEVTPGTELDWDECG